MARIAREKIYTNRTGVAATGATINVQADGALAAWTATSIGKGILIVKTDVTTCTMQLQGRWGDNDDWANIGAAITEATDGEVLVDLMPQMRLNISALTLGVGTGISAELVYPGVE